MNGLNGLLKWCGEVIVFASAPLWNYPDRMRRVSQFLLRGFAVLISIGILIWISQRPVFALRQVIVEPVEGQILAHVNKRLVKQQVLETVHGNFFTVKLEDVKRGFETLPWVRHVNVRRVWPNGLIVSIEEQKAIGTWGGEDSHTLMNAQGELFAGHTSELGQDVRLIDFHGPEDGSKEVMRLYLKANHWFKAWDSEVKSLTLSERYAWHVKLSNGLKVEFGRDEESSDKTLTEDRVARLFQYWPQVQEKWLNRVDAIDLRYANGFAIHLAAVGAKKIETDNKKISRSNEE